MNTKEGCLITKILCLMTLTVSIGSHVFAVPIIDGRFDPSEGYTNGFYVNFSVEGDHTPPIPVAEQGELWWYQNPTSNDLFVAFIQPLTLVDNSYGANAIGWGASAHSGKNHKFQELIGSDDAQFVFTDDDGNTVLDITVDYLHGFGYKPDGKPDKNLPPFRSGGVTDGDGKVNSGSKLDVLAAATSLQYNWDTFGDTHPELFGKDSDSPAADENYNVDDPSLSNWVFEVIYEVRVDGNLFDTNGFGGVAIPLVHDSPNKIGKNKVWPEIGEPIPDPIPEPTTIVSIKSASSNFWNSVKLSTLGNSPTASIWILLAKSDLSTLNSQSKQK